MSAQIIILAEHRRARDLRKFTFGAGAIIWPLALLGCAAFWLAAGWGAMQIICSTWVG